MGGEEVADLVRRRALRDRVRQEDRDHEDVTTLAAAKKSAWTTAGGRQTRDRGSGDARPEDADHHHCARLCRHHRVDCRPSLRGTPGDLERQVARGVCGAQDVSPGEADECGLGGLQRESERRASKPRCPRCARRPRRSSSRGRRARWREWLQAGPENSWGENSGRPRRAEARSRSRPVTFRQPFAHSSRRSRSAQPRRIPPASETPANRPHSTGVRMVSSGALAMNGLTTRPGVPAFERSRVPPDASRDHSGPQRDLQKARSAGLSSWS